MDKKKRWIPLLLLILCLLLSGCGGDASSDRENASEVKETAQVTEQAADSRIAEPIDLADVPEYNGEPFIEVNGGNPAFSEEEFTTASFESYSELDELGRCRAAYANIGEDLMPTEKRGSIGKVKPSGWHSVEYDIVDGKSLYNRCHLIGYQLTAENANEENLITGTRYLNTEGMLPFENMVADYIKETKNHVLYRVTPLFEGDNLVADGVQMEAVSVEDRGEGILFNVFCYNVQPGISIDYATGESQPDGGGTGEKSADISYILNTSTHKFHKPSCSSVKQMKESNTQEYTGSRDELESMGYDPCKQCKP